MQVSSKRAVNVKENGYFELWVTKICIIENNLKSNDKNVNLLNIRMAK